MNYIVANSICCCLQCCCKQVFETLYKIIGKSSFIKIMYFIIYVTFISVLLILFIFLRDWPFFMDYIARGIDCSDSDDFDCITASLIYRMLTSISVFIIFLIVILSLCNNRISHILNEGLFFSKFVIISAIFIVTLQLGNNIFEGISVSFQYLSYIFLIFQAIIMIDVGYLWGIRWADKYSIGQSKYGVLLIVFTVLMFGLAFGMNIYGYILVSDERDHMNSVGLTSNCPNYPNILATIFICLCIGVQLLNFNKQNSLLTTSFMSIYISFWCFSAIYSSSQCNLNYEDSHQQGETHYTKSDLYYFGSAITMIILIISTFGSIFGSTNKIKQQDQERDFVQMSEHHMDYTKSMIEGHSVREERSRRHEQENKTTWIIWHFFMLTMIIYLSMVLTDWGSGNLITGKYSLNQNAFNSKLFMGAISFTFYVWTLLAPRICPNRNFYFS